MLFLISLFIFLASLWVRHYFGQVSFETVIIHVNFDSLRTMNRQILYSFIIASTVAPIISFFLIRKFFPNIKKYRKYGFICLILSFTSLGYQLGVFTFINSFVVQEDVQKDFYKFDAISFPKKNNLVLIYFESLENTFESKKIFGENLIAPLSEFFPPEKRLQNIAQFHRGGGWTIAGIINTQCGIPLIPPLFTQLDGGNFANNRQQGDYLRSATCLGDILKNHGYYNVFMGGADNAFAAKGNFFKTHGYHEVLGKQELLAKYDPNVTLNVWGLSDDDLLARAKLRYKELYNQNQPFNLTLLTVDSHADKGLINNYCKKKYPNIAPDKTLRAAVKCSAELVRDFIDFIKANDPNNNTSIALMGDHVLMYSQIGFENILPYSERFIFIGVDNPQSKPYTYYNQNSMFYDMFPLLLHAAGAETCRHGFGQLPIENEFGCKPRSKEEYGQLFEALQKFSRSQNSLWK